VNSQDEVLATLDEYAVAYCNKDTDRIMRLFADEDISLIGTGADELCSGHTEVRAVFDRNFSEATAEKFDWQWRHIIVVENTAVIAVTFDLRLKTSAGPLVVPIRWTVSLVRRTDGWKWLHRHASAAAGGQKAGGAYPE